MVGHEIWLEILKNVQTEKHTLQDLEYGEKLKNVKIRNTHSRTWKMARNLKNVENQTRTLYICFIQCDMPGNTEKRKKLVMHTAGLGIWQEN